jgi:hypothetical protein
MLKLQFSFLHLGILKNNQPFTPMKQVLFSLCLCGLSFYTLAQTKYPEAEIKNEQLQVKLYLPDADQGYYLGTRFDWAGVIGSLEYQGHQYFGPWLEQHDPKVHDAISGPVEAFTPIGFETAKPGGQFLTIGVGVLRKPDNAPHRFATTYEIVNPGEWKVKKKADRVEFIHTLSTEDGYAYEYTKTVRLIKGKPKMVLEHSLKNTGKKIIETTVYNHNFFVIDHEPTGPNIVTKFPYPVQAEGKGFGEMIVARDQSLIYEKTLQKGENVFTQGVQGFGSSAEDYNIRIENIKSGAGVLITADQPLLKLVYWACHTTACPEPYIEVKAEPGQTFSWNINYEFYTLPADTGSGK